MKSKENDKHTKLFIKRLITDLDKAKEDGDIEGLYKMGKNYIKMIEVQTQLSESYYKKWKVEANHHNQATFNNKTKNDVIRPERIKHNDWIECSNCSGSVGESGLYCKHCGVMFEEQKEETIYAFNENLDVVSLT